MPKEKLLFFIGIWVIVLSHFIGLPTEIKDYLFIATGALLVFVSYGSSFSQRYEKEKVREEASPSKAGSSAAATPFAPSAKTRSAPVRRRKARSELPSESSPDKERTVEQISPFTTSPSYDPPIRVRKARIKAAKRPAQAESSGVPFPLLGDEEDDVIVISSDNEDRTLKSDNF